MFNDQGKKKKVNKTATILKKNGSRKMSFISIAMTESIMGSQLEILL